MVIICFKIYLYIEVEMRRIRQYSPTVLSSFTFSRTLLGFPLFLEPKQGKNTTSKSSLSNPFIHLNIYYTTNSPDTYILSAPVGCNTESLCSLVQLNDDVPRFSSLAQCTQSYDYVSVHFECILGAFECKRSLLLETMLVWVHANEERTWPEIV